MISDGIRIELSREETLGLVHVLNSIVESTAGELENPSIENPLHHTEAPVKPLLLKLLLSAVNAEYINAPFCIRPSF